MRGGSLTPPRTPAGGASRGARTRPQGVRRGDAHRALSLCAFPFPAAPQSCPAAAPAHTSRSAYLPGPRTAPDGARKTFRPSAQGPVALRARSQSGARLVAGPPAPGSGTRPPAPARAGRSGSKPLPAAGTGSGARSEARGQPAGATSVQDSRGPKLAKTRFGSSQVESDGTEHQHEKPPSAFLPRCTPPKRR